MIDQELIETYTTILHEELVPAMGCTEPIAIAYAGAIVRDVLGTLPDTVELMVSGNIIKNVKSVIVPHTGGRKGLKTAVGVGISCGRPDLELEVLSYVTSEQLKDLDEYLDSATISVKDSKSCCSFDI